jgi:hypothetical protein
MSENISRSYEENLGIYNKDAVLPLSRREIKISTQSPSQCHFVPTWYRLYDVLYVIILLYSILYWCILQLRKKKKKKKKKNKKKIKKKRAKIKTIKKILIWLSPTQDQDSQRHISWSLLCSVIFRWEVVVRFNCWYWWNCWPSLFKFLTTSHLKITEHNKDQEIWRCESWSWVGDNQINVAG